MNSNISVGLIEPWLNGGTVPLARDWFQTSFPPKNFPDRWQIHPKCGPPSQVGELTFGLIPACFWTTWLTTGAALQLLSRFGWRDIYFLSRPHTLLPLGGVVHVEGLRLYIPIPCSILVNWSSRCIHFLLSLFGLACCQGCMLPGSLLLLLTTLPHECFPNRRGLHLLVRSCPETS